MTVQKSQAGVVPLRPSGTTAFLYAVASGALLPLLVGGGFLIYPLINGFGIIPAALGLLGGLTVGAIKRLAGGEPKPLRVRRTITLALSIPIVLSLVFWLLLYVLA